MKCGNCGHQHATAAEVKACFDREPPPPTKKHLSVVGGPGSCRECGSRTSRSPDGEWDPLCKACYHRAKPATPPERRDYRNAEETQEWLRQQRERPREPGVPAGLQRAREALAAVKYRSSS